MNAFAVSASREMNGASKTGKYVTAIVSDALPSIAGTPGLGVCHESNCIYGIFGMDGHAARRPVACGMEWTYDIGENRAMRKRVKGTAILLLMAGLAMAGCGRKNHEAMEACKVIYAQLVDEHNVVIGFYADSPAEEYEEELNRLGSRIKEIGQLDVGKMEGEELDALETEMKSLMDEYEEIYGKISGMAEEEPEPEHCQVSVTLKNMTTLPFFEVYFYNSAKEETRENLVTADVESYDGMEIFSFVNLVMDKDETVWRLETMDHDGLVIESEEIDLAPYAGGQVVIEMWYSFDTNEGWVELKP